MKARASSSPEQRKTRTKSEQRRARAMALAIAGRRPEPLPEPREHQFSALETDTERFRTLLADDYDEKARKSESLKMALSSALLEADLAERARETCKKRRYNRNGEKYSEADAANGRRRYQASELRLVAKERGLRLYDPECDCLLCSARKATGAARYYRARARGQRGRFRTVQACRTQRILINCRTCGHDENSIPSTCGVRRVCAKCAADRAVRDQVRFGRARARFHTYEAKRYGLHLRQRRGGRFTEKLFTQTAPHFEWSESFGEVRERSTNTVEARVIGVHLAATEFWRSFNAHLRQRKDNGEGGTGFVRRSSAFEWTEGSDGKGHPHFHSYLWSPFVDSRLLEWMWADALTAVGVPVKTRHEPRNRSRPELVRVDAYALARCPREQSRDPGFPARAPRNGFWFAELLKLEDERAIVRITDDRIHGSRWTGSVPRSSVWFPPMVSLDIRHLKAPSAHTIGRELHKNSQAAFRKLAHLDWRDEPTEPTRPTTSPGQQGHSYAAGWSMCDVATAPADVRASLFRALEGRAMTRASSGFHEPTDPQPCQACGQLTCKTIRTEHYHLTKPLNATRGELPRETGPP